MFSFISSLFYRWRIARALRSRGRYILLLADENGHLRRELEAAREFTRETESEWRQHSVAASEQFDREVNSVKNEHHKQVRQLKVSHGERVRELESELKVHRRELELLAAIIERQQCRVEAEAATMAIEAGHLAPQGMQGTQPGSHGGHPQQVQQPAYEPAAIHNGRR